MSKEKDALSEAWYLPESNPEPVAWKETIIELFQSVFDSEMLQTDEGEALIRLEDAICYVEELVIPTHDQPERDKVDFQTLNEMGLRRLQVSDNLVLQESCAKSPTLIFAENGNVIEIIKYKKLLEIKSFIDEILNYADTPQIGVDDE